MKHGLRGRLTLCFTFGRESLDTFEKDIREGNVVQGSQFNVPSGCMTVLYFVKCSHHLS